MSTETINSIAGSIGRLDGGTVRPVIAGQKSSPLSAPQNDGLAVASTTNVAGQKLSVPEQELPPKEAEGDKAERLQQAVSEMNSFVQNLQRDLQFKLDTDLDKTVISIVDSTTKEVIRTIPSEQVLDRLRGLKALAETGIGADGLLLKEQA